MLPLPVLSQGRASHIEHDDQDYETDVSHPDGKQNTYVASTNAAHRRAWYQKQRSLVDRADEIIDALEEFSRETKQSRVGCPTCTSLHEPPPDGWGTNSLIFCKECKNNFYLPLGQNLGSLLWKDGIPILKEIVSLVRSDPVPYPQQAPQGNDSPDSLPGPSVHNSTYPSSQQYDMRPTAPRDPEATPELPPPHLDGPIDVPPVKESHFTQIQSSSSMWDPGGREVESSPAQKFSNECNPGSRPSFVWDDVKMDTLIRPVWLPKKEDSTSDECINPKAIKEKRKLLKKRSNQNNDERKEDSGKENESDFSTWSSRLMGRIRNVLTRPRCPSEDGETDSDTNTKVTKEEGEITQTDDSRSHDGVQQPVDMTSLGETYALISEYADNRGVGRVPVRRSITVAAEKSPASRSSAAPQQQKMQRSVKTPQKEKGTKHGASRLDRLRPEPIQDISGTPGNKKGRPRSVVSKVITQKDDDTPTDDGWENIAVASRFFLAHCICMMILEGTTLLFILPGFPITHPFLLFLHLCEGAFGISTCIHLLQFRQAFPECGLFSKTISCAAFLLKPRELRQQERDPIYDSHPLTEADLRFNKMGSYLRLADDFFDIYTNEALVGTMVICIHATILCILQVMPLLYFPVHAVIWFIITIAIELSGTSIISVNRWVIWMASLISCNATPWYLLWFTSGMNANYAFVPLILGIWSGIKTERSSVHMGTSLIAVLTMIFFAIWTDGNVELTFTLLILMTTSLGYSLWETFLEEL